MGTENIKNVWFGGAKIIYILAETEEEILEKMKLPDPEFVEERGAFKVVFRNSFDKVDGVVSKLVSKSLCKLKMN